MSVKHWEEPALPAGFVSILPCGDFRLGKLAADNIALVVTFGRDFEIVLRRAVQRHGQCSTNLSHPLVRQPSGPFDENGNRHASH